MNTVNNNNKMNKKKEKMFYTCQKCNKVYKYKYSFLCHECKKCQICSKSYDVNKKNKFLGTCSKKCKQKKSVSAKKIKKTIQKFITQKTNVFNCQVCGSKFKDRKLLYVHRKIVHRINRIEQEYPSQMKIDMQSDDDLNTIIEINKDYITSIHNKGSIKSTYNYAVSGLGDAVGKLSAHLKEIYDNENNAFKINFSFGIVLKNNRDHTFRYYIRYQQKTLLY